MSMEYRHTSTGSIKISPSVFNAGLPLKNSAASGISAAMARFDGPRSPPGRQNTSHVPCKFFRAGACQAGNSCPFSHDPASTTDNICKYFAKGNCRFGPKCANIHVLPDGRRVNYSKTVNSSSSGGHVNIGNQISMDQFSPPKSVSALTNSLPHKNNGSPSPYTQQKFAGYRDEKYSAQKQGSIDISVLPNDAGYVSISANHIDEDTKRYGLGSSVPAKTINAMERPLPASFDSNGVSWLSHHYSLASSVPSSFGIDPSPEPSGARDGRSSETLKNLHYSVFGETPREGFSVQPASPPGQVSEDYLGFRARHASRSNKIIPFSLSTPKAIDKDWEANFTFEEDYLPETLKDLMTPQEKARRGSRNADDDSRFFHAVNGTTSNEATNKFGSPSNASPSRWRSLFQRQQQNEEEDRARVLAFGHVGSPLRKSSLHPIASPKTGPIARPCNTSDSTPLLSSPSRRSSMSIISEQLQNTRISQNDLNEKDSLSPTSHVFGTSKNLSDDDHKEFSCASNGTNFRRGTPINEEIKSPIFKIESDELIKKRQSTGRWHTCMSNSGDHHLGSIGRTLNGMYSR
ncbi:putative spindle poison sensitivity protein scp3 [Golovinomyces cichoracearum]|uniref:Putative spindle poison sensitivity protein scp3 n=1 Tax=Golovinomyces cichoracearum TaxID=62708 RepID=A0A420HB63_9PEZI|nr:putative spindle poison sensitivity protein scp3 [Golovinomyces cichoracearum]